MDGDKDIQVVVLKLNQSGGVTETGWQNWTNNYRGSRSGTASPLKSGHCSSGSKRRRFLDGLLAAVEAGSERRVLPSLPLALLLTLRADFMGHALAHRPFAYALQDASLMMGPMSRDELRRAIERPAERRAS